MNFNTTKFDAMRRELDDKHRAAVSALGVAETVPVDTPQRTLHCDKHGDYDTRITPSGVNGLRAIITGTKPSEMMEHRSCPVCLKEIDAQYDLDKSSIDKQERDEIKERGFRAKIDDAGVAARYSYTTLEKLKPVNDRQERAISIAQDIIQKSKDGKAAPNLIMTGSVGTGKSLIAAAAVQSAIRSGMRAEMATVMGMIRDFRATWKKDCDYTEAEYIRRLTTVDLLVIDEVGVQYGSDSEKLFVFDVIDGRYRNMRPTIMISNLNLDGIRECIGERCVDRVREDGGKVVTFDFESQRGKV